VTAALREAIATGRMGERLWFYANYHCNLACSYCLTGSAPDVPRRELAPERMVELAIEARELGFRAIGVTGGEPFLVSQMPDLLLRLSECLPTVVLSNGTLFTGPRFERMRPLAGSDVRVQISLDRSQAVANDEMRGPENFRKVVEAVPQLVRMGIGVRIATTLAYTDRADLAKLCALHRSLGVSDEDHVVRGVIRRGRALTEGLGEVAGVDKLMPEVTITADGVFWSPFAPTVTRGRLDTDLLIARGTRSLAEAATAVLATIDGTGYAGPVDDRFT
jgi:MoaA/NifB/PqqE/SkfB family radical SAM enzyme